MITIPEGKKLVYDKVEFSIAIAASSFAENIKLREGVCVGVKAINYNPAQARLNPINIAVTDSTGTELTGATDFRDYTPNGGGYLEGFKPVKFDTRSTATVSITSPKGAIATAAFEGQVIFAVLIDC